VRFLLLHSASSPPAELIRSLDEDGVRATRVDTPEELLPGAVPTAFLLDPASRATFPADRIGAFTAQGGAVVVLGDSSDRDGPPGLPDDVVTAFVPHGAGARQLLLALRSAYREAAARRDALTARREAESRTRELKELTEIGMALATERNYDTLLEQILSQALQITGSDAGSLYIVEQPEKGPPRLRFKLAQNQSRPDIPFAESTMTLDVSSIAGNAATTGEPLNIPDVYRLEPTRPYTFNRWFDETYGYRSKSMLTIPMKDHKGDVIGVLQLINRKRHPAATLTRPEDFDREVLTYSAHLVDLVSALAGQAAVSIENSQLYEDIERLFEGFVRAAVSAIEQRDPPTRGHSRRVANMTVALARVVDGLDRGRYGSIRFTAVEIREIRYAALLHDFGKVGVREHVLVKAKKLYPHDLALIRQRYAFIRRTAESEHYRRRMHYLEEHGAAGYGEFCRQLDAKHRVELAELDHFLHLVQQSNEPTVLPEGSFEELMHWANTFYSDIEGKRQPFLTDDEVRFLSIRKGSLDESERSEIESHVNETYRFLLQIPWTPELQSIPRIAYGHHEKLDGSGYPRHVGAPDIPIQTRMMTIVDIYDALTASDRPYKRAVSEERALDILADETRGGMLDEDLFRLFRDAHVFERASDADELDS
jgi:HD-GYP domain-containing protein (c-di-GMP phosphodiesterase class II)